MSRITVTFRERPERTVSFRNLAVGDLYCHAFGRNVYRKVSEVNDNNAFSLDDNRLMWTNVEETVIPLESEGEIRVWPKN